MVGTALGLAPKLHIMPWRATKTSVSAVHGIGQDVTIEPLIGLWMLLCFSYLVRVDRPSIPELKLWIVLSAALPLHHFDARPAPDRRVRAHD